MTCYLSSTCCSQPQPQSQADTEGRWLGVGQSQEDHKGKGNLAGHLGRPLVFSGEQSVQNTGGTGNRGRELSSQLSLGKAAPAAAEEQWEPHMVPAHGHTVYAHACCLESQTAATLRVPGSSPEGEVMSQDQQAANQRPK